MIEPKTAKSPRPAKSKYELAGMRFGMLEVAGRCGSDLKGGAQWWCRCDCEDFIIATTFKLRKGLITSCGCKKLKGRAIQHGHATRSGDTSEYGTWHAMRRRCSNPLDRSYPHYGGRGITVCQEWQDSFQVFLEHMGRKPSPEHSLDRIDVNKGYSPDNCRWATRKEQANNTRRTVLLTYMGKTMNMTEWAKEIGVSGSAIRFRIDAGLPIEEILKPGRRTSESNKRRFQ